MNGSTRASTSWGGTTITDSWGTSDNAWGTSDNAWGTSETSGWGNNTDSWSNATPAKPPPPAAAAPVPTASDYGNAADSGDQAKGPSSTFNSVAEAPKNWASLFAKPAPAPQKKAAPPTGTVPASEGPAEQVPSTEQAPPTEQVAQQQKTTEAPTAPPTSQSTTKSDPTNETATPPVDDLTETNLEQLPDISGPATTLTAASTAGSALQDGTTASTVGTPARQQPQSYTPSSLKHGFRTPGFRRVMEQQEAVVMPGNHAVDRAAVQFGSMGLNGGDTTPIADIDEHREEAETRTQPPLHSPVAPRASLPPSTQAETVTVSRPAPGFPPMPQQVTAGEASFNDLGPYAESQKAYDPFTGKQGPEPFANQASIQPAITTSSDFSAFYALDQQRLPYNYYGAYSQAQDATAAQRAAVTGFGGISGAEVQPPIATMQPPAARYGQIETPESGHATPNPTLPAVAQTPTAAAAQHMPGQAAAAAAAAAHGGYGYGYPYYSNPHYASYMSQMTQHQYGRNRPMYDDARRYDDHYMPHSSQFGYGSGYGPYAKAAGMYGQPQHAAAFSYDQSTLPGAAAATFNNQASIPGRGAGGDSMYPAAGRAGSGQQPSAAAADNGQQGGSAFGMSDVFGRTPTGGFAAQNQPTISHHHHHHRQQPTATTAAEEAKGFDTPKAAAAGGPSPSLAQRPGSAAAAGAGGAGGNPQAGLPPFQSQGQLGVYPQLNPQYAAGGLGSLGGHQAAGGHHGTGYGNYGAAGFGAYYGNPGRGGWGGNYGH